MTPVGLEPAVPGRKRLQTQALDRTASGIGCTQYHVHIIICDNLGTRGSGPCIARLTGVWRSSTCH